MADRSEDPPVEPLQGPSVPSGSVVPSWSKRAPAIGISCQSIGKPAARRRRVDDLDRFGDHLQPDVVTKQNPQLQRRIHSRNSSTA